MKPPHSFDSLLKLLIERKVPFLVTFFAVVVITYGVLYIIDFIPEHETETEQVTASETIEEMEIIEAVTSPQNESTAPPPAEVPIEPLPIKMIIDKLDKEIKILNPTEATIPAMDAALLEGAVRHPDSADFEKVGNIFLLGHSSYLPNVFNKNFQAFNGIQELTWGDKIRLQSGDTEYVYSVKTVRKETATEAIVPYTWGEAKLTLVTCNVYGAKEDRFVVVAELVESTKL
tara:strand:+ start:119 stop:811 length:693 start_codon:yes stop_codon:yes gene_type:complete